MRCRSHHRCLGALGALALSVAAVSAPADGPPARESVAEERARVRLHTVRLRIDPQRGASPRACAGFGPGDLAVRLRGRLVSAADVVELERGRAPALHALLIDASGSMVGKLAFVREAVERYVGGLPPDDRALLIAFDEDVRLLQPATAAPEALVQAVRSLRMGEATALHDGLFYAIDELNGQARRPVVVLLTDGVDTASLYERDDVRDAIARRGDLTVFAIGHALPEIQAGRPGVSSAKRFLQHLAERSGGAFFDVPTAGRLDAAYRRIRDMLANEAVLVVRDPEPDAEDGALRVRSRHPDCRVTVFEERDGADPDPDPDPAAQPEDDRVPLSPGPALRPRYGRPDSLEVPRECPVDAEAALPDSASFLRREARHLEGCLLDVAMDVGMLYGTHDATRWEVNDWIDLRIRPFEVEAPPPATLPASPVGLLGWLAERARERPAEAPRTDPRKRPAVAHARPFEDVPWIVNGRVLLDQRAAFAESLFRDPAYAAFVHERLEREAEAGLSRLVETWRRRAPELDDAELLQVAEASPAGRRLRRRAARPEPTDRRRYLGGWLGDVSAHDLFTGWEALEAGRLLRGEAAPRFDEDWETLRRLLFVPSYARIVAPLHPGYDPQGDRIGFWRIVLPRASWMLPRVQDRRRHPEFGDLPLDLVPDAPLGYRLLRELLAGDPAAERALRAPGWEVRAVRYELTGKPFRRDPARAFRSVRVTLEFEPPGAAEGTATNLRLVAELRAPESSGPHAVVDCAWEGRAGVSMPRCRAGMSLPDAGP